MSVARNRFFWKMATAATLAAVAVAASGPRAAVPQRPATLTMCPGPSIGTASVDATVGAGDQ